MDEVINELETYGVIVGALHKTKWFGNEIYKMVKYFHSYTDGRSVPIKGEGVTG